MNREERLALIDTGCSVSLIGESAVCRNITSSNEQISLVTMGGGVVSSSRSVYLRSVEFEGKNLGPVKAYIVPFLPLNVDMVIGMDVISVHGLTISGYDDKGGLRLLFGNGVGGASLGSSPEENIIHAGENDEKTCKIDDPDFVAQFKDGRWEVAWKWKNDHRVGSLSSRNIVSDEDRKEFDAEIKLWLDEGIITEHDQESHGEIKNYLNLIAIRQVKGSATKVRPVLDYRSLNKSIQSHTGGAVPICASRLRDWRQMGRNCSIIDLKKAYLQVAIRPDQWVYQAIRWKGKDYLLTRLGFGLTSAPKIMTAIVEKTLSVDPSMINSVSSYIDDLIIDENQVACADVVNHLQKWGLHSKEPQKLGSGPVRVLGLEINEEFQWSRDSTLPVMKDNLTRREAHGLVGQWCGHYPVLGWLRVACGYIQRCTAEDKTGWDEPVSEDIKTCLREIEIRLKTEGDPAKGNWCVNPPSSMNVWTDASSMAIGVLLEVDGEVVEDGAWLRAKDDVTHINRSELDAVVKGLNMALRWGVRIIRIFTDSLTVYRWLQAVIDRTHNVKTRALDEVLIQRRLSTIKQVMDEEKISISVTLIRSEENKADALTRVPKKWLAKRKSKILPQAAALVTTDDIAAIHNRSHFGVSRTYELAKERYPEVDKDTVTRVVRQCDRCARIDPAITVRWEKGTISAESTWQVLSVDIAYVRGVPYLSVIDVSSGYTVWRKLSAENASSVTGKLREIFGEFGPPESILSDNGAVFRSREMLKLLEEWEVLQTLTCAYRHQGNPVERVHRTIKRSVQRSNRSVEEAVFWLNNTRAGKTLSPHEQVFAATPRKPGVSHDRVFIDRCIFENFTEVNNSHSTQNHYHNTEQNPYFVGDIVYLRPPAGKCDVEWSGPHYVTDIRSRVSVVLDEDGISRHISHIRRVPSRFAAGEEEQVQMGYSTPDDDSDDGQMNSPVNDIYEATETCEIDSDSNEESSSSKKDPIKQSEKTIDEIPIRHSNRDRRRPTWQEEFVMI